MSSTSSASSSNTRAGSTPLWSRAFVALLAAQACFGYAFSSFFLLPTFLSRELGASASEVGWVMSTTPAVVIACLPVVGHLVDRTGRKWFLVFGGVLMSVACALFATVTEVGSSLYLLRVVQAIAFSMSFAAGGALAADLAPQQRMGQAMGLFGLTFLAMNGVAGPIVELVSQRAGWPIAFALSGVAAGASALLSLQLRDSFVRPSAHELSASSTSAVSPVTFRALTIIACVGLALGAMFNFAQLHATALGIRSVSHFFLAYAATAVVIRGGFGHLLDDWGLYRVSTVSLTIYVAVAAATVWLDLFGLIAIGSALGIAHGIFYPAFSALTLSGADARMRARVVAHLQAAFSVGGSASAILGWIADRAGFVAVFWIAAVALAAALWLLVTQRRPLVTATHVSEVGSA